MRSNWPRGINRDLESLEGQIAERGLSIGKPLEILEEIDSTNDAAKRAAKLGAPSGALFVAESQTRGRGRQGRAVDRYERRIHPRHRAPSARVHAS